MPQKYTMPLLALCFAYAPVALTGCTWVLDWGIEGLPCDENQECLSGFSCLGNHCVADRSIENQGTCSADIQCQEGLACNEDAFVCGKSCIDYFGSTQGVCAVGEFCAPHYPPEATRPSIGGCQANACSSTLKCKGQRTCVEITPQASACLLGCQTSSNCGNQTCTPIGVNNTQVCMPASPTNPIACSISGGLCNASSSCVNGSCK